MNTDLCRKVGEVGQDNLIAKLWPPAETFAVKVKSGEGVLKRGSVLALNEGEYTLLSTETTGKANCILADDVDATEAEAVAVAYRTGHFNAKALMLKEGYTLSEADREELRKDGILLTDTME